MFRRPGATAAEAAAARTTADRPAAGGEAEVVQRARLGDAAAVETLYRAYVDRVHRFAYSRLHDDAEARDVAQDVFVRVVRALPGLRDAARFAPWLMQITHMTILERWRRTHRTPTLVALADGRDGGADGGASATLPAPDDPARDAQRNVERAEIALALARLTDLQQQVVTLRFIAELSVADTAAAVGCSQDAVKKLQRRGLASLRLWLDRESHR